MCPISSPIRIKSSMMLLCMLMASCHRAPSSVAAHSGPFDVPSGVVEYSTVMRTMNMTLYFDDYGNKQAGITTFTMNLGGRPVESKTIEIPTGEVLYKFNPTLKTGTRIPSTPGGIGNGILPILESDFKAMESHPDVTVTTLPNRTYAGQDAYGYSAKMTHTIINAWFWKGIPLHIESEDVQDSKAGPLVRYNANSIQLQPVPTEMFVVPGDVKLEEKAR